MVAVSEKTEASEKSVEKGSAMTKVLVMDACFKRAMSHTDFCAMIGDAIDATSHGENYAREWTSHPCYNGDVFFLGCLNGDWLLELGPEAKGQGNKMQGCAGSQGGNSWGAKASNWQR